MPRRAVERYLIVRGDSYTPDDDTVDLAEHVAALEAITDEEYWDCEAWLQGWELAVEVWTNPPADGGLPDD